MKTSTRIALLATIAAGWAGSVALIKIILPPAVGAAVVGQMASSDTGYLTAFGFSSAASIATGIVTAIFGVLAIRVLRAK